MPRGNPAKLIPNSARTPQERKDQASRAGRASGEARRKQKNLREAINSLLSQKLKDGAWEDDPNAKRIMERFGLSEEDKITALAAAAILSAVVAGSPQHAKLLADMTATEEQRNALPANINITFADNSEATGV